MAERIRMEAGDRVEQIVEHATALIAEKGYFGFSVGELAKRCGLSNAGLIHHIGSKEHALEMVLEARDRRDALVLGLGETTGGAGILHRLVAHNATQPMIVRLYAILRAESLAEGHPSHDYFRRRDALAIRAFEALLEGFVPEPHVTARAALALMGGLEEQWLREPEGVDLVDSWDAAYAALLAGARG